METRIVVELNPWIDRALTSLLVLAKQPRGDGKPGRHPAGGWHLRLCEARTGPHALLECVQGLVEDEFGENAGYYGLYLNEEMRPEATTALGALRELRGAIKRLHKVPA